jgi:N-acetylmuramoyl-L-alanine amidase
MTTVVRARPHIPPVVAAAPSPYRCTIVLRLPFLALLTLAAPAHAVRITAVTVTPGVVTIATDTPMASAHSLSLDTPDRLVIDLPAVLGAPLAIAGAGSVTGVRGAMFAPGTARLVLDLARPLEIGAARATAAGIEIALRRTEPAMFAAAVKRGRRPLPIVAVAATATTAVPPQADADFELPPTLFGKTEPAPAAPATAPTPAPVMLPPAPASPPTRPSIEMPRRAPGVRARSGGKPLVVIDAGHGGKDVGAISVNGGYEKAVTLAIAQATARILERGGKVRVKLTRGDDRFIPLGGRVAIARAARADLFISIHADSAPNPMARGASVYTLSAVASDAVAARLAARENKADIIGGVNLGVEAPDVGDIMIDLSRRATTNVSVAFSEILQDELSTRMNFRGEFHHFAGFLVLKAADVPSVLLETGYVSNAEDSEFLFSDSGRRTVAQGVARAIERHLLGDR